WQPRMAEIPASLRERCYSTRFGVQWRTGKPSSSHPVTSRRRGVAAPKTETAMAARLRTRRDRSRELIGVSELRSDPAMLRMTRKKPERYLSAGTSVFFNSLEQKYRCCLRILD